MWRLREISKTRNLQDVEVIAERMARQRGQESEAAVLQFIEFLQNNELLATTSEKAGDYFTDRKEKTDHHIRRAKILSFLSIRLPLLQPDRYLERLLPKVSFLFSPVFWGAISFLGIAAFYMLLRQPDAIGASLSGFASPAGIVIFLLVMMFTKICHETGHALIAKKHGVSVPTMGMAFIVFWPVLYTDASLSWKVADRKARMQIDAAGIVAELAIAAVALFLWNFLPEGPLKGAMLMLATVNLAGTLFINLNPFMKFDGYHLLGDALGIHNLHGQASGLLSWWFKSRILGISASPPVTYRRWLLLFAVGMFFYRFLIAFFIAAAIFLFVFKTLATLMVALQIYGMMIRPFSREVSGWWQERSAMRFTKGSGVFLSLILVGLAFLFVPWQQSISLPAHLTAQPVRPIIAALDGRIEKLPPENGSSVRAGDLILQLEAPDLAQEITELEGDLLSREWELGRIAFSPDLKQALQVLETDVAATRKQLKAKREEYAAREIIADFSGIVRDRLPGLKEGSWVARGEQLGVLVDASTPQVVAYGEPSDIASLKVGLRGEFRPHGGWGQTVPVTVHLIEETPVISLSEAYTASHFGGGLEVFETQDNQLSPLRPTYRLILHADGKAPDRVLRGTVKLNVPSESIAVRYGRRFIAFLRQEFG